MKDSRIQEVKDSSEMPKLLLKMSQLDRGIRVAFGFCIDLNPKFGDVVYNAYKIKTCSPINSSVHCETVRSLVKLLHKEYPAVLLMHHSEIW